MRYRNVTLNEIEVAENLYKLIIKTTPTWDWGDDYPNYEMIVNDIKNNSLVGMYDNEKLIAVSFIGDRYNPDHVKSWKLTLKNPARWARICVHPNYQKKGVGTIFTKYIINDLKSRGYDGIRIIVAKENLSAIKLYNKFKFNCVASHQENGIDWWCYEKKLEECDEQV